MRTQETTSGTGSTAESACVCNAGYYLSGGTCTQCLDGTYKAAIGDDACTSCGNSGTTGGSTASTSSSSCVCAVGYYRDTSQSTVCRSCGTHETTSGTGSTAESACVCKAGYYHDGSSCTECLAGSFKSSVGNEACESCEAGKYGATTGQTVCANCDAGEVTTSSTGLTGAVLVALGISRLCGLE